MSDPTSEDPNRPGAQPTPPGSPAPSAEQPAPPAYTQPAPTPPAPQPYGAPQQYPPSAPQYPGAYPPPAYAPYAGPKTNALSIVSLVASLVGLFLLPLIGSIAGVITGHISLGQIKRTNENGHGMALAGVIIGWVGVGLAVIGIILLIWLFASLAAAGAFTYRDYYRS